MSTARSNVEIADWSGKTTSPDGDRDVTDESGSGSPLLNALRTALGRVISTIRAFAATLPAEKARTGPAWFGDYEKVEEAKYYSPGLPSLADDGDLPEWPGPPKVTLLAVDPYLVHVYWDFDLAKLPPDTTAAILRFYDVAAHFDVDVDLRTRNWYVPLWSPAKTYYADLGAITAAGEFIPLVRSNTIQTPRAWPVAELEHRFVSGTAASPQSDESLLPPTPAFPSEHAGIPETRPRDSGSAKSAEPPAAKAEPAVSLSPAPSDQPPASIATALPTEQHIPKPADAAEILRRRLSEIHEFRQRQPQAQRAAENLPAIPPLPASPDLPDDLTAHSERQFSPGLSSLLLGAQDPRKPAG
jgi:hypothetical protein